MSTYIDLQPRSSCLNLRCIRLISTFSHDRLDSSFILGWINSTLCLCQINLAFDLQKNVFTFNPTNSPWTLTRSICHQLWPVPTPSQPSTYTGPSQTLAQLNHLDISTMPNLSCPLSQGWINWSFVLGWINFAFRLGHCLDLLLRINHLNLSSDLTCFNLWSVPTYLHLRLQSTHFKFHFELKVKSI